jgi:Fe-S-cluster containining protein
MARNVLIGTTEFRDFLGQLEETARTLAETKLIANRSAAGLCDLAHSTLSIISVATETLCRMLVKQPDLACKAGCWRCCDAMISSFPLYTIHAALAARSGLSDEAFAGIQRTTLSARTPCPMLVEGVCSIYSARPPVCRHYYSFDYDLCLQDIYCETAELEYRVVRMSAPSVVLRTVNQVLIHGGLDCESQHLDAGLRIIFTEPDAINRWLAGEKVFTAASRRQGGEAEPVIGEII